MAKKESKAEAFAFEKSSLARVEARLLTIVESLGLDMTREGAVKRMVRNEVWDLLDYSFEVSKETFTSLLPEGFVFREKPTRA